ncbi:MULTISPECIES: class I SAM-dependent methyltransferase [unclassified Chelatococcus]|uniref:class I SAM-dependent methyltransferase n=1 Tax=unclassified Chelatococcus TaxID=2638111 RepID=UPI00037C9B6C|nr:MULTISPECIES: class I SAM-dependent methyltransferase [unclassified Chelatococcus]
MCTLLSRSAGRTTDPNQAAYRARSVVSRYRRAEELQPAEAEVLEMLRDTISNKRILDIGVGGGRTTPYLLDISRDYIGIDYSPEMVRMCREAFPGVSFQLRDARYMDDFEEGSFDFILFSFNGIDYVDHESRLMILRNCHRLLSIDGSFAFSTHNRRADIQKAWDITRFRRERFRNPLAAAKTLAAYVAGMTFHMARARHEEFHQTYAIINDQAHLFRLMTYYIAIEDQITQLHSVGFDRVLPFGIDGKVVPEADYEHCRDRWIYYLCRRALLSPPHSAH